MKHLFSLLDFNDLVIVCSNSNQELTVVSLILCSANVADTVETRPLFSAKIMVICCFTLMDSQFIIRIMLSCQMVIF